MFVKSSNPVSLSCFHCINKQSLQIRFFISTYNKLEYKVDSPDLWFINTSSSASFALSITIKTIICYHYSHYQYLPLLPRALELALTYLVYPAVRPICSFTFPSLFPIITNPVTLSLWSTGWEMDQGRLCSCRFRVRGAQTNWGHSKVGAVWSHFPTAACSHSWGLDKWR